MNGQYYYCNFEKKEKRIKVLRSVGIFPLFPFFRNQDVQLILSVGRNVFALVAILGTPLFQDKQINNILIHKKCNMFADRLAKLTCLFFKPGFHSVYHIGTMPRFVTLKTWFCGIIHYAYNNKNKKSTTFCLFVKRCLYSNYSEFEIKINKKGFKVITLIFMEKSNTAYILILELSTCNCFH